MIGWLYPSALAGLALLAVPVLIHLLRTHRAERIPFPSLRFVKPSRSAAVRARPPSDLLLLCVRVLIVAAAVLAAARPVLVTSGRVHAWDAQVVRAVIVDGTAGRPGPSGTAALDEARQIAANERTSAMRSIVIESTNLREGIAQAADWLSSAPPARREVVVISSFHLGALADDDLAALSPSTGVRLLQHGAPETGRHLSGGTLLSAPGVRPEMREIELAGARTRLTLRPSSDPQAGLRVAGATAPAEVERLLRSVATAGAPAPSPQEPMVMAFGSDPAVAAAQPLGPATPRWMLRALLRAQADPGLADASRSTAATELPSSAAWTAVATDRDGRAMVRLAALGESLAVQVAAEPGSLVAAAALRALLHARAGDLARPDEEILRTPPQRLAALSRPPSGVEPAAWRRIEGSDARWLWLAVLTLLGLEHFLRRVPATRSHEARRAA